MNSIKGTRKKLQSLMFMSRKYVMDENTESKTKWATVSSSMRKVQAMSTPSMMFQLIPKLFGRLAMEKERMTE
jgi:hypothetical protein